MTMSDIHIFLPANLKCHFGLAAFFMKLVIVFLELPVIESVTVKSAVLVIEPVTVLFMLYGIELVIVFFRML